MRLNIAKTELLRIYPPASADGDLLIALSPSPDESTNPVVVIAVAAAELVKKGKDGNNIVALVQHLLNEREALLAQLAAVVEGIALRLHRNALALAELGRSASQKKREAQWPRGSELTWKRLDPAGRGSGKRR
jgi:hypothetical protein